LYLHVFLAAKRDGADEYERQSVCSYGSRYSDLGIPHTSPEEARIFYEDQIRVKRGGCDAEFESNVLGKLSIDVAMSSFSVQNLQRHTRT
jgi:hypothetical protein